MTPAPSARARCLSETDVGRLLEACTHSRTPHLSLLVSLALSTGARQHELLACRWQDIDVERGLLQIAPSPQGVRRAVPLTGAVLEMVRQQAAHRRQDAIWVFPRADGQRPVDLARDWAEALRRAGLPARPLHDLRHTAAMTGGIA